ncbi:MAG: rod shape-determining protein MreD [Treponema sp.]|jgi:rod shape-determining protein MreD|nr:rod shape-determining protein MreD [Treponema sp.]
MIKSVIWTVILAVIAALLGSTIKGQFTLDVFPDIALCILVFSAYVNGTMTGQISGFFSGLFIDFLSAAPLGLSSLVRTLIGAFTGIFKGAFFLDILLMPVILCAIATILKAIIMFILHLFFGSAIPAYSFTSTVLWIELGMNCIIAPPLFLVLKRLKPLVMKRN